MPAARIQVQTLLYTGLQAGFRDLSYQDTDEEPKPELHGLFPDK